LGLGGWGRVKRAPSVFGRGLTAFDPSHPKIKS